MYRTSCAILALCAATSAHAQQADLTDAPDEIIVTGTRSAGRSALQSSAPIDVIHQEALEDSGYADLNRALNFIHPSVNFARAATTASAANTRPVTLRGLSPDQTLVLVNGRRRHGTSILNVNNSIGRGSAGADLDTIPPSAIARIEVLRDGAAAQYGSDAIAGVVNIILRSDASGVWGELFGSITEEGDGEIGAGAVGFGLPLGEGGHFTVTAALRHQEPTNRALVDQRFNRITYRIGDPLTTVASGAANATLPLGAFELYGVGTLTHKVSNNGAGFRVPGFSPIYPNGFLPIIEPTISDIGATLGLRGELGGLQLDISHTFGRNEANFRVSDTANVSLGAASPTEFDSGGVTYQQHVTDAVVTLPLPRLLASANVAAGAQYRSENYAIRNGEPDAYFGLGADGFAGFNPRTPTDAGRDAYALFIDAEVRPFAQLLLGAAVRYDEYSDFGGETTWRATARFDAADGVALRGTVGTGFKAPSLQQQFFSAIQGALSAGQLVTVGTLPVSDPVARAVGAAPLRPERSRNQTFGVVFGPFDGFSFTADYFHIAIEDRIALSEQLGGAAVLAILRQAGITNFQQVRFFTNAVDTTTEGIELTAAWQSEIVPETRLAVLAGYGFFQSRLDALRPNPVLPTLPLLSLKSILFLTEAQPANKFTLQAGIEHRQWEAQLNLTAFGTYESAPLVARQTFDGGESLDLAIGYRFGGLRLTAGVQNLFDARPEGIDDQARFIAATGGSFPTGEETPLGLNGRTYYLRLSGRF